MIELRRMLRVYHRAWMALLMLALSAICAWALEVPPAQVEQGDGRRVDVYIDDSFEAEELLSRMDSLVEQGEWIRAASIALRLVEDHGERVSRKGSASYTNLIGIVNRRIVGWPAEGLAAYRSVAEARARAALMAAEDDVSIAAALLACERYFCTRAGAEACVLAGELALEGADFRVAERVFGRLLAEHPDRERLAGEAGSKLAIVYAVQGKAAEARELAGGVGAGKSIEWLGGKRLLAEVVEQLLDQMKPAGRGDGGAWPVFGGNLGRTGQAPFAVDDLAIVWRFTEAGDAAGIGEGEQSTTFRRARERGRFLSVNPVASEELLYVQDGQRIRAIHLGGGHSEWSLTLRADGDRLSTGDAELPQWFSPTLAGGRVYACVGSEVVPYYGYDPPEASSSLVCLDAASGEIVWRVASRDLGDDYDEMAFESTPIVVEGGLYCIVRRKRSFGFEDCFLYSFDARTGAANFRAHLGSASTGGFGYRRPTLAIPARMDESIFVCTNLGTVASIDRYTGLVRWLAMYDRITEEEWRRDGRGKSRELNPWQYNAVFCDDAHVYALPTDADSFYVLDRETGLIRNRLPIGQLADVETLLGLDGSLVFGVGAAAFCYDLESATMIWQEPLPDGATLLGRGLLTVSQLLAPAREGLCVFDRADGQARMHAWDEPGRTGNLLALSEHLIVAGDDHVTAYARKRDVLARLRERMDSALDDPAPALELADILQRSGDIDAAIEALDEAIVRGGGFAGAMDLDIKERIFEQCMRFAASIEDRQEDRLDTAYALYERAAQCPTDTDAHLRYRLKWAALCERMERWERAVALYQQLVADRSLRDVASAFGDDPKLPAGRYADGRIGAILTAQGRGPYERFDVQAADMLAAARSQSSEDMLMGLVDSYPNSMAAADALLALANLRLGKDDPIGAARALYRAWTQYPRQVDGPDALRRIADCYVQAGRPGVAWQWLTKAARRYPTATIGVEGKDVSFKEYRERLGDVEGLVGGKRCRLNPPLIAQPVEAGEGDAESFTLLEPLFDESPGSRTDLLLVYRDDGIYAHRPASAGELWDKAAACPIRPDLIVARDDVIVLSTRHQLFGLRIADGERLWSYGVQPAQLENPLADPELNSVFMSLSLCDDSVIAIRDSRAAARVDMRSGETVWEVEVKHSASGPIAANGQWIVYQTMRRGGPNYCVLDASTGALAQLIDPDDDRQIEHLFVDFSGDVLLVTTEVVHCFDAETGQRRWRKQWDQPIRSGSVRLEVDGLYLSTDGRSIEKLRLTDGRRIWQSDNTHEGLPADDLGLSVWLADEQVLVTSQRRVSSLSAIDGRMLWQGTVPRGANLRHRFVTEDYLVAIDSQRDDLRAERTAYFYDLRNASGLIPSDGGVIELGVFDDERAITVRDGALLLHDGNALHVWAESRSD